jgi:hypothetical protein
MQSNLNASSAPAAALLGALSLMGPAMAAEHSTPTVQVWERHCPSEANVAADITPGSNTQYLSSFEALSGGAYSDSTEIGGVPYPESLTLDVWTAETETAEYNLSREWKIFKAVAGVSDKAPTGSRIRFEVFGDKQRLYCKDLEIGQADMVDVDVSDVLRLELRATLLSEPLSGMGDERASGVWGDAIVEK